MSFFLLGSKLTQQSDSPLVFMGNILLMMILSSFLAHVLFKKITENIFLILMLGMIFGTLFRSFSTFFQILMDPNEFQILQGKTFASFGNVDTSHMLIATIIILLGCFILYAKAKELDVLLLGFQQATSLGISVKHLQLLIFLTVGMLVATSTALVGPVTFLGFMVSNISYQLLQTYKHQLILPASALTAILFLVLGQFIFEQLLELSGTLSMIIEFTGGTYYIWQLVRKRGQI